MRIQVNNLLDESIASKTTTATINTQVNLIFFCFFLVKIK